MAEWDNKNKMAIIKDKNGKIVATYKVENGKAIEYMVLNGKPTNQLTGTKYNIIEGRIQAGVKELSTKFGVDNTISYWHDTNKKFKVVVQPDMKTSPVKVTRSENNINVEADVLFRNNAANMTCPDSWLPYSNIVTKGLKKWEGVYNVRDQSVNVNVNINVINKDMIIPGIQLDEYMTFIQYLTISIIDKSDRSYVNYHGKEWSVDNPGDMVIYARNETSGEYRDVNDTIETAAHEFGHILGMNDAYGEGDRKEAEFRFAPAFDIMNGGGSILDNDIAMMNEAWMTNEYQYWQNYNGHKRSTALRDRKDIEKAKTRR